MNDTVDAKAAAAAAAARGACVEEILCRAIVANDAELVRKTLTTHRGAFSIDKSIGERCDSLLHLAVRHGAGLEVVHELVSSGINIARLNRDLVSAYQLARNLSAVDGPLNDVAAYLLGETGFRLEAAKPVHGTLPAGPAEVGGRAAIVAPEAPTARRTRAVHGLRRILSRLLPSRP